jgi:hypothetical protein
MAEAERFGALVVKNEPSGPSGPSACFLGVFPLGPLGSVSQVDQVESSALVLEEPDKVIQLLVIEV